MTSQHGLYVYGLVGEIPQQLNIVGIDKIHNVYPVAERGICAIVSEINVDQFQKQIKDLSAELTESTAMVRSDTGAILQAHEDVIDVLMQHTTVVPLKFATIVRDEKAVSKMLQDYEERFKYLLSKFTGRAEWGLKVYADKQSAMKYIAQVEPRFTDLEGKREKLSKGAAYLLGRKIEEAVKDDVAARLTQITEAIFQALQKEAFEAKLNDTLPRKVTGREEEMVLNAVYLVDREKEERFREQGKRQGQRHEHMGLTCEISGPWPPYNFT